MDDERQIHMSQSWYQHVAATLRLGIPLIGAQLAFIGLSVTDTIMLGWLGAEYLAAGVLGTQLFFWVMTAGSGMAHAVSPIVSNAAGAGDLRSARRAVRMAIWGSVCFCIVAMWPLWFSKPLFVMLRQDPELAELAQTYLRIALWALPLTLFHNTLRSFLSALEHAAIVLWATIGGLLLNAVLNYCLIFGNFGAPELGIRGAAIATLGTNALMFTVMAIYAFRVPLLKKYEVFRRLFTPDWAVLRDVFRLGWPISLTLLAEVSLFTLSSIMMGWLGVTELAAHGIALQITATVFMVPLGLSFAATVRVGRALGRKDALGLYRASVVAMVLGLGFAALAALLLVAVPRPLISLFMEEASADRERIMQVGVPLLAVAALFQLVDAAQAMCAGLLRGLKDTKIPMLLAVFSYLGLGMSAAYMLAFPMGWGAVGVWSGLAVGLTGASVLLGWRYAVLMRRAVTG